VLSRRMKLRIGSTAALVLAALSLGAASASAGVLSSAPSCDGQSLSTPFVPWLDFANYTPLPAGDFETSAAGWTLTGGASVADGNEPFHVSGPGSSSLSVPSGGSAISPALCVGVEHPIARFFAKRTSGGALGLSTRRVDVIFENLLGSVTSLPIGVVTGTSGWQPTLPMTVLANLQALVPGQHPSIALRFTPMLGGDWSIDDVQVDPYSRR
jgi:hypothetical protein